MRSFLALVMLAASIGCVNAAFVDGNKLLEWCSGNETAPGQMACIAFVAGVSDSLDTIRDLNNAKGCTPTGVTLGQSVDVVRKYLYLHPEQRHVAAAMLVVSALGAAWCKQ